MGDHTLYALLADGAARQLDRTGLSTYAPLAEETAGRYDHVLYQAIAHRAWGVRHRLAGQFDQAEARLNRALLLFQELGARWQSGLALAELGRIAVERADSAGARAYLGQALALFEEIGARPDAENVRQIVASLG